MENWLFVCSVNQIAADDGWSSVLQACKGKGSRKLLEEDKKGSSKDKKDRSVIFGLHL